MAENIAKIDEKIRELKRKKKTAENREKIKDQSEAIKAINQSLKNSKIKIEKITEIVGFLQEQESSGNWLSKWLAKQRAEK
jgi:predicted  nucleic acid-binding Zn-ribbon protein